MSFHDDVDKSTSMRRLFGKRLIIAIIIVSAVPIAFSVWFIFISDTDNDLDKKKVLPSDCYSVNGKQTCPKR
jgi:hypothetical protein